MIEPLTKQPRESRLFDMDFSGDLSSGEQLLSVTTVEQSNHGLVAGSAPLVIGTASVSGSRAQIRLSSGTDGETYTVTLVVTTDQGNTLEGDGDLIVAD